MRFRCVSAARWRRALAALMAVVLCLAPTAPATGQSATGMVGKTIGADPEVINAAEAAEEALKAVATKGRSAGGATGPISKLLTDSDELICHAWVISIDIEMKRLAVEGEGARDSATAAAIGALQNLKNKIEAACNEALNNKSGSTGSTGVTLPSGEVVRADCPECDEARLWYEQRQSVHDRAEFDLDRAKANTQFVLEMWAANPANAGKFLTVTPEEAERIEATAQAMWERAKATMDAAHKDWIACVEACHQRNRLQYGGWFSGNRPYYLAGGAGAALLGILAASGGGEGATPGSVANTPGTSGGTPATGPSPAGTYRCTLCVPTSDPDRHESSLRFCTQMTGSFVITVGGTIRIFHPPPWVPLDGTWDASSLTFSGTGTGAVNNFPNVSARGQGIFQRSGDTITGAQITLTLGENAAFPGGRPFTVTLTLGRQ